jgi:hypothetical protein
MYHMVMGLTIRIELTGRSKRGNKSGMSIWMDNAIARLTQADKKAEKEREWLLHKHAVIKAKGPAFWQQFWTFFEVDLNKFNGAFSDEHDRQLRLTKVTNAHQLSVRRASAYPQFELQVSLEERTFDYEYTLKANSKNEKVSNTCSLELGLDSDENIVVLYDQRQLSYNELSEVLLEPLLFPNQL